VRYQIFTLPYIKVINVRWLLRSTHTVRCCIMRCCWYRTTTPLISLLHQAEPVDSHHSRSGRLSTITINWEPEKEHPTWKWWYVSV